LLFVNGVVGFAANSFAAVHIPNFSEFGANALPRRNYGYNGYGQNCYQHFFVFTKFAFQFFAVSVLTKQQK